VIVPLALVAGLFQAFIMSDSGWLGWPEEASRKVSAADAPSPTGDRAVQALTAALQRSPEPEGPALPEPGPSGATDSIGPADAPTTGEPTPSVAEAPPPATKSPPPVVESPPSVAEAPPPVVEPPPSVAESPRSVAAIRVFIHHTAGDAVPAIQLAAFLETHGFDVADIRPVRFDIEQSSVRYFFDRDQPEVRRLVEALRAFFAKAPARAPDRATDFTFFSPKPRRGNVEIWLSGHRGGENQSSQRVPSPTGLERSFLEQRGFSVADVRSVDFQIHRPRTTGPTARRWSKQSVRSSQTPRPRRPIARPT
jgi:hypothetical protein